MLGVCTASVYLKPSRWPSWEDQDGSSIPSSELVSDWNQAITSNRCFLKALRMTIENKESPARQCMSIYIYIYIKWNFQILPGHNEEVQCWEVFQCEIESYTNLQGAHRPKQSGSHQNPCGCYNHKDMMKVNAPKSIGDATPLQMWMYIIWCLYILKKDMSHAQKKDRHHNLYNI